MESKPPTCTSPNDRLGSPGFLLRPPDASLMASMSVSSRNLSAMADGTTPSPSQVESFRRSRVRVRARLETPDVSGTPTRHSGQRTSTGSWRPPWTPPGAGQATSNALSGLPPLSRPQPTEYGPAREPREHDQRWTCGNSAGGTGSAGGWGSSSGGGHHSGASSGGTSGAIFAGSRQCHDSFASTQKPLAQTPDYASRRPSPVPEHGQTGEFSTTSTPNTGHMRDYAYPSARKNTQLPDYMKVFTVPNDVHYEEDVIIEPIIQNLGIGDKQMEQRITEQMGNLYDFFRRLYDQDQEEVRLLQAQVEQRDMELRCLRRTKLLTQEEETASPCSPSRRKQRRDQVQTPTKAVGQTPTRHSVACSPPPPSSPKQPSKPFVSVVVPPVTNPARPFFKWWASVHDLYSKHSTLWQGCLFVAMLILAVGLLAGLLSNRSSNSSSAAYASHTAPNPAVVELWSTGLAFTVNMSQGTSTYFALIPTVALLASNHTPSATDLRALLKGPTPSALHGLAVACGERTALQSQPFTFHVHGSSAQGMSASLAACEVTGAVPDRCSLCPVVQPATAYTLLVAFADGEDVHEMQATTAPLSVFSPMPVSTSPTPSLPAPSLWLGPSSPPSSSSLSPASQLPSTQPPASPAPAKSPAALAPDFKIVPTMTTAGPTSFEMYFSLASPGLLRFQVLFPVLYAQAGGILVSFASADPAAGQALTMGSATSSAVLGLNGVVAAGTVNVTTELPYTLRVDGSLTGTSNAAATCSCDARACSCRVAAPCQGQMCNLGASALTPNTTYKVFASTSTPDGAADSQGPLYLGTVTTGSDDEAPMLSSAAVIPPKTITPTGFSLAGLQMDTAGLLYIMVSRPSGVQQQSIPAGTATGLKEDVIVQRRLLLRSRLRSLLQQSAPTLGNASSADSLLVMEPAPVAQVFMPACPRKITCDAAKVVTSYLDEVYETLAFPVRCMAVPSTRGDAVPQVLDGLANDTTYTVRVITEDVFGNQRVYRGMVRTLDRRPPDISAVLARTSFQSFNLTVTLSEPGAVTGFLYTAVGVANISLTAPALWPPSPQGFVIQQATASTSIPSNGTMPMGVATYVLSFNDPSISPKTNYSVALVARDLIGNVQPLIKLVAVQTDDNLPPVWLLMTLQPGAFNVTLVVRLDEPSTAFWFCIVGDVSCPRAETLFGAADDESSAPGGLVDRGNITVSMDGGIASSTISGLKDGLPYTLCLVAQDASPHQNRQTAARRLTFNTLDRTPPTLLAFVIPGTDGNFTCDRSSFRCRLSLNISLSEAGTAVLALQYADARLSNFTAATLIGMDLIEPPPGIIRSVPMDFNSSSSRDVHLADLPSGRAYSLDVAGVDSAGNVQATLQSMTLIAPDVTPPSFTSFSAASVADTFITANVSLNEPSTVLWSVAAAGAPAPNVTQLVAAVKANQTLTGITVYAPGVAGVPVTWSIGGLAVGQYYDVYLLARDTSGNQQVALTSILRVRVQDSTPPVIYSLTTLLAPTGNRLIISVNASKPGTLRYTAVRFGAAVPTRQQLLQPTTNLAANFSGQLAVPTALSVVSAVLCVMDGVSYQIWAVQEDTEGRYPNRQPNYSNVTRAIQLPQPGADNGTCSPEGRMRALVLDTSLYQGSLGWPVGRVTPAAFAAGNTSASSWYRDYILIGGLGGSVGTNGSIVASMEGRPLGYLEFQPARPPPTQVRLILQTPVLVNEPSAAVASIAADVGRVLRFAFQLLDSASRPTGFDGLRIVARLNSSLYGTLVLPDCSITAANSGTSSSLPSGIGLCRVEVPVQAFPAAGASMQASMRVDLYNGSTVLLSSAPEQLNLRSVDAASPSPPASGAILLLALPTRALHPGETFRTTVSAFVGSQQTITGFTVRLLFNSSRMTFVRADKSSLWSDMDAAPLPDDGGGMALWLSAITRTAASSMYQNRTVPLLDAYFRLADSVGPDGSELAALGIRNDTSTGSVVLLSAAADPFVPVVMFQDFRGIGVVTYGSISIAIPRQLGLLAYLTNHDLFNSAVLDGKDVIAPIQALIVSDWASSGNADSTLSLPSGAGCTCSAPANASSALSVLACQVVLTSIHNQAIKQTRLNVLCVTTTALRAQAIVSVWYPGSYRVESSDPDSTLSSLLPVNVPASAVSSCTDRYQSTRLHLLTTWMNGGISSQEDYLTDVDVTQIVSNWTADAPQALRLLGSTATGLSPHPGVNVSAISAAGTVLASMHVAISSEPVCVESLEAVALSRVTVAADGAPNALGRWRVHFTPQQALNWEGASAKVSVFATFSDGTTVPVSVASTTTAKSVTMDGSTLNTIPFSLTALQGFPSLNLVVNSSFGSPATCGTFMTTSWSVCAGTTSSSNGVLMATGSGTVRVALPTPTRIDSLQPSSSVVASAGSGASQPPISVPTQSYLKVMVAFDDGIVRDMTADPRVQVLVVQGADLCRVLRDSATGQPYVEALAGQSGTCGMEARASFAGLPILRGSNTTTVVTLMSLLVYVPDGTPALPPTTNSSTLTNLVLPIDPIYLFKCDFSHYMPASVWAMGQLSSCGASCNLADLNDPSVTRLLLTDTSVANLATNPSNISLTNVLQPIKPGKSVLRVSFGSAISNLFTVSVEDPFLPGWPRVLAITDTGCTIAANMSSGSYKVTYLVRQAAELQSQGGASTALPSAADIERAGVAMTAVGYTQTNPCMLVANITGLAPATNYTIFLAVRFEVTRQSKLINTAIAISGVLTSDRAAPTFSSLGGMQNITLDSQRFRMRVPIGLSESGTISYVVYRNSSCISGAEQLPVQTVRNAGPLPSTICGCVDSTLCQPVAWGNITLSGDQLSDLLSINGLLPPNPYDVLSSTTTDKLTCNTDYLPAPTTAAHMLYIVAQDDLPTYKDWNVTCVPPSSSPGTTCSAIAFAPCSAVPPATTRIEAGINVQDAPYKQTQLGQMPANATSSPILASFNLPTGDRVAFDQLRTNVTVAGRTITFVFKVSKVAAVQYRLDQFNGARVYSGVYPVYDPAVSYSISISKTCNGTLLGEASYTLWYWATDVYGRSSLPLSSSVLLG